MNCFFFILFFFSISIVYIIISFFFFFFFLFLFFFFYSVSIFFFLPNYSYYLIMCIRKLGRLHAHWKSNNKHPKALARNKWEYVHANIIINISEMMNLVMTYSRKYVFIMLLFSYFLLYFTFFSILFSHLL